MQGLTCISKNKVNENARFPSCTTNNREFAKRGSQPHSSHIIVTPDSFTHCCFSYTFLYPLYLLRHLHFYLTSRCSIKFNYIFPSRGGFSVKSESEESVTLYCPRPQKKDEKAGGKWTMVDFKETNNPSPQKLDPLNQLQKELRIGQSTVWGPTASEMEMVFIRNAEACSLPCDHSTTSALPPKGN